MSRADVLDSAFLNQEENVLAAIQRVAVTTANSKIHPNGVCHSPCCGDDLSNPKQLFCDAQCAQDYQKYSKLS